MTRSAKHIPPRATCPHCWHVFPLEETLWVSSHPALIGDARLGAECQRRFLPTRFDVSGNALDSQGAVCSEVACPKCHLVIPRAMFEMRSLFYSILGSPGSGKSHLIATTTWTLRKTMGKYFHLSFADADPDSNRVLNQSEERLFFSENPNELTTLPKTEKEGSFMTRCGLVTRHSGIPGRLCFRFNHCQAIHTEKMLPRCLAQFVCTTTPESTSCLVADLR